MKHPIFLITTLWLATFVLSCSHTPPGNSTVDHNAMDHSHMNHGDLDHSAMQSSPNAAAAPYDLQFLDTMIAHHQGAIDMARPAMEKGGHREIVDLAKNIIASQEKEVAQMKAWRDQWFNGAPPAINMEMAGMHDSMKDMDVKKLGGLTGTAFDFEFLDQMIPHHDGAIIMAKDALNRSTRSEIKSLANAIITAQESEINTMKKWRTESTGYLG